MAKLEKELRWGVFKGLVAEVADLLVPNEMGTEQDDFLATCKPWLDALEERGLASIWREVDLCDLTTFGGFESSDTKKDIWARQIWGISIV